MEDIDINELKNLNKYWIENVSDSEKIELEGLSEKEIIDTVIKVANQLNANEGKLRESLINEKRIEKQDEVYKSFGILKYARK